MNSVERKFTPEEIRTFIRLAANRSDTDRHGYMEFEGWLKEKNCLWTQRWDDPTEKELEEFYRLREKRSARFPKGLHIMAEKPSKRQYHVITFPNAQIEMLFKLTWHP